MTLNRTSAPSDDGFTFIEVIVAIAIISFSSFILWSGISGTFNTVSKVYNRSRISGELGHFEFLLRKEVNEIEIPYWNSSFDPQADFLFTEDEKLFFQNEQFTYQFSYLTLDSLEMKGDGVEVQVQTASGETHSIFALYGSFPMKDD